MFRERGRRKYRIFICHSWHQREFYRDLIEMLHDKKHFSFIDRSVPSEREIGGTAEQIWEQIKMQICASDAVLAINTVAATRSRWIPLELEAALSFGKDIVAVCPDPRRADRPSRLVEKCASVIVAWRIEAVVDAIQAVYAEGVQKEARRWRDFKESLRA